MHDHRYGSPKAPILAALDEGRDVLFDIDWQGAASIAGNAPDDVVRVFILPPSMPDLERRLYARAQDSDETIQRRLMRAPTEIAHWGEYDYVIVNDDFDQAYARPHPHLPRRGAQAGAAAVAAGVRGRVAGMT